MIAEATTVTTPAMTTTTGATLRSPSAWTACATRGSRGRALSRCVNVHITLRTCFFGPCWGDEASPDLQHRQDLLSMVSRPAKLWLLLLLNRGLSLVPIRI